MVLGNIEYRKEERFIHGKRVDASYDAETEHIIFWGNLQVDDYDLVIILMHEIGHLLFHKVLSDQEKRRWLKTHAEESLDFGLDKEYPLTQIPEETFACLCSIEGMIGWLEGHHMNEKAKKLKAKLKRLSPKGSVLVKKTLHQTVKKDLFHSTVKTVRNWIEKETGPLDS